MLQALWTVVHIERGVRGFHKQSVHGHVAHHDDPGGRALTEKESNDLPPVFGRYRIDKKLDGGGMGTVYLAYDTSLDRRVALKVPHLQFEWFPETIDRLLREARAAASFHDPSFCTVYDIGQIESRHYIAMEYVEGRPLKAHIDPDRPMAKEQAVLYVMTLARAMAKAHERDLHRDLKPANVMINLRGELVILDFGLALRLESDDPELTSAGQRMGTPHYMAPSRWWPTRMRSARRQTSGPWE